MHELFSPCRLCSNLTGIRSRSDVGLRSRYAKKLGLKDKVCRVSELILGRYLALFELAVVHNAITNEMFPLRVDPEVGGTSFKRTGRCLDRDAVDLAPG